MQPGFSRRTPTHPFAPWLVPPEQLERTLVGRQELLEQVLRNIAGSANAASVNHLLLVGPRGIGKTHLLCLVNHYVSGRLQAPPAVPVGCSVWEPVLFVEEQYARFSSLAHFLLGAFEQLRETQPGESLWQVPEDLGEQEDPAVCDCCFERLGRYHRERHRKVLLLVDNLRKVLEQWSREDQDRFRAFLSRESLVLLIGTAPSLFEQILSQQAAFYDFFEICAMGDLDAGQSIELLGRRFREDGRQAELERRRVELAQKMDAIRLLAGGNPRLITFLYQIVTGTTFLEIESALHELLEDLREYFMKRFDDLQPQARKILDTLAEMPGPATPTDLAKAARLPRDSVNVQLRRLTQSRYVYEVNLQRQKKTHYDITERLFRIWRQTATVAGKRRFRFLVDFLKIYYTPDEVRCPYVQLSEFLKAEEPGGETAERHERQAAALEQLGRCHEALGSITSAIRMSPGVAGLRLGKARVLAKLERVEEALVAVAEAERLGAPATDICLCRGHIYLLSGRYPEAETGLAQGVQFDLKDWNLQADHQLALGCLGRLGPKMEALAPALERISVPEVARGPVCRFMLDVATRAARRGEATIALGLFNAVLFMPTWHETGWYGEQLGVFLRGALDASPGEVPRMVALLAEKVTNSNVIRLLDPFLQAAEFLKTGDVTVIERHFPEVRELILAIVRRIDPGAADSVGRGGR